MKFGPLVSSRWLLEHVDASDLAVVDCRFSALDDAAGRHAYDAGHIPGAAFLDVDRDLSGTAGGGRHPLPDRHGFARSLAAVGIGADTRVVAYDEAADGGAARLWWLLRHHGHADAAVLDGGLRAWRAAGGVLDRSPPRRPRASRAALGPVRDDVVDADELVTRERPPNLLDARAPERYRGDVEPLDPVAGHIPGARNVPSSVVAPGGRYLPAEELRALLGDGPERVAYCGSGVTACTLVLAGELAGVDVRLYPGSWSDWSRRRLPAARA